MHGRESARLPRASHPSDILRFGSRFFPRVQLLSDYVAAINESLPAGVPPVVLVDVSQDSDYPAYVRLTEQVLVGWSDVSGLGDSGHLQGCDMNEAGRFCAQTLPPGIVEGLTAKRGTFPHDEIISRVISSTLTKHPHGYDAQSKNVLCNGFTLGRPHGPGSVFRNLDARAPSSAVNMLRSPPWRRLFSRIGHVAARHLLTYAAFLVPLLPPAVGPESASGCVTLMQLCGPLPRRQRLERAPKDCTCSISLKQDVLYHGFIHSGDPTRASGKRCDGVVQKLILLNPGLPAGHELQSLRPGDAQAPRQLFHIIFSPEKRKRGGGDEDWNTSLESASRQKRRATSFPPSGGAFRKEVTAGIEQTSRLGESISARIPKRMQRVLPVLEQVVSRTGKRSFRAVLSETCPLSLGTNPAECKRPRTSHELAGMTTKSAQVARFLVRSLRQVLPLSVFGSSKNRTLFEEAVRTLVRKRTQNESFNVEQYFAENGLSVTDIEWLYRGASSDKDNGRRVCNPTDLRFRGTNLTKLCIWLVRSLCLPLLWHNFYVSESESSRHRIVYFRREIWAALTDNMLEAMVKSDHRQFSLLSTSALAAAMRQRDAAITALGSSFCPFPVFAYSHIRFLPKSSGARGIQRPRAKLLQSFMGSRSVFASKVDRIPASAVISKSYVAMKLFYANTLEILWSESRSQPLSLGASVFSNDSIYLKYSNLVRRWLKAGRPRMYFVCMDITRSFDTVPLPFLLERVIPSILQRNRYIVLRYAVVKRNISNNQLLCRFCHYVCEEPGEESHFPRLVKKKLGARHRGALFIDLASVSVVQRSQLLASVHEVLSNNVVTIPKRARRRSSTAYAVQSQGLPQGSPLSSILTSLFYGFVERADLAEFLAEESGPGGRESGSYLQVFLRQIDDTLFVSGNEHGARRFAQRMTRGWDDTHGFVINPTKTRASFDPWVGGKTGMRFMPWCGYVFDAETMEVRGDYDRYVSKESRLRDTLSIVYGKGAMEAFLMKASTCFRPKLHALLLDSRINSKNTIVLNLYQAAMLSALKLCSYATALLPSTPSGADPNTPNLFAKIVKTMLGKFRDLARLAVQNSVALRQHCVFPLGHSEISFIVVRAFFHVLRRHLSRSWFADPVQGILEAKHAELRFASSRGQIVDLEVVYASALHAKATPALWSLRL
jgi:Telomerase ribonucleoprotein complex - RNA binding domain